jgi:hypothetical protein
MKPLNSSITDLDPDLKRIYEVAVPRYDAKYPLGPRIEMNETSRNELIQDAYHAQGRVNLAPLNELRKKAGLPAIGLEEARNVISNARYGQSPHNFLPSRAFDTRATHKGFYIGLSSPYFRFWLVCKEVADEMDIAITWGGTWKDWPHIELTHWRSM